MSKGRTGMGEIGILEHTHIMILDIKLNSMSF